MHYLAETHTRNNLCLSKSLIFIRIDGTKWKIISWSCLLSQHIEKSRFPAGIKYHNLIMRIATTPYPTFGKPTMPHLSEVPNLPSKGPGDSDSDAPLFLLGGMVLLHCTKSRGESKVLKGLSFKCRRFLDIRSLPLRIKVEISAIW